MEASAMHRSSRLGMLFPYPRRVRLWHFVVFPAIAMGLVLLAARLVESWLETGLGPVGLEVLQAGRTVAITVVMASLIAWLAVRYRGQYEAALEARNKVLEETRDFLSSIIEGSAEGIVTLDAEGQITSWNPAAERIFGWSPREMIGQSVRLVMPDDPQILKDRQQAENRIQAGEILRDHKTVRVHKTGKRIVVLITRSPLYDSRDRYAGSVGIVRDVTGEHEMELRLREQQRLAAVGEMAAQVAHEIRNPLAGIRGACETMFSDKVPADVRQEVAGEVLTQIDRLNRTVEELLQYSRPQPPERIPTDLHQLLDRVVGMIQEDPQSQLVKIVRTYTTEPAVIPIDTTQIEQLIFNLLLNACQAVEQRGTITIETERVDDELELVIGDSGPGIPRELLARIFEPFFTTRSKGTGLGLAIVKKIVVAHGGHVEATSLPEMGAKFRVRLPVNPRI